MQRIEQEYTKSEYTKRSMNFDDQMRQEWSVGAAIHCARRWVGRGTRCHSIRLEDVCPSPPIIGRNELLPLPILPFSVGEIYQVVRFSVLILCILASFLFFPLTASAHVSASSGHITGQLLDGTKNNTPLAGQQVTLQEAQGANAKDVSTVTTDVHGDYSFSNLSTDKTINYAVYMSYQGAQYLSALVALDTASTQKVNLTVYEATKSTAKIAVLLDTILMHQPDPQTGLMNVSEILSFRNLDSHTYVGSFDTSKGKPNTLRFSLPGNAKNVTLGTGFDGYQTVQVDLGFATNATLPPGITQFSFSYQIPYTAAAYNFRYVVVYPTLQLSLLVPPTLQVDPGFMSSAGITNSGDHPYRLFQSSDLLANDEVHVTLEGLTAPTTNSSTPVLNTNTIWLIVGGIVLLAIIAIVGFLSSFNRRKKRAETRKRSKGKSTTSVTAKDTKKEVIPTTPKDKKEALLQELLTLDKSYESGKLSKAVYNDRRAKTKARLRSLLSEQEAARR